ncbi:MAG: HNH endonuclease [Phaeodactylibacter sp.]|nr:HNH endonuclease [Phaeodactylibacter sp.]
MANPFTREDEICFEQHIQRKMLNTWRKRTKLVIIFRRQTGKCPMCNQVITKQTGWHIHHKIERNQGGKDSLDNLLMLHPNCHYQAHHLGIQFDGDVPKRASEHA